MTGAYTITVPVDFGTRPRARTGRSGRAEPVEAPMTPPTKPDAPTSRDTRPTGRTRRSAAIRRPRPPSSEPSRLARMLALGHHIDRLIDDGKIADAAEAAAHLGLSRARLTQIVNLTLLSPEIQEQILAGEIDVAERVIRSACSEPRWDRQRKSTATAGEAARKTLAVRNRGPNRFSM